MMRSDVCLLAAPEANFQIADCGLPVADFSQLAIGNRKLAIGNALAFLEKFGIFQIVPGFNRR
jgi:hypothetical protein